MLTNRPHSFYRRHFQSHATYFHCIVLSASLSPLRSRLALHLFDSIKVLPVALYRWSSCIATPIEAVHTKGNRFWHQLQYSVEIGPNLENLRRICSINGIKFPIFIALHCLHLHNSQFFVLPSNDKLGTFNENGFIGLPNVIGEWCITSFKFTAPPTNLISNSNDVADACTEKNHSIKNAKNQMAFS